MAKGHKHLKHLKSEKAKVKLKSKTNRLPKNLNITDTSFKAKKIVIREQLKHHDETEILSTRKLNIKDLLMRLRHHNKTVRIEALRELKEILLSYSPKALYSELGSLLRGIAALSLDKEKSVRRDSLSALRSILEHIPSEQLIPHLEVLTSYLNCAMTHINQNIKEDSLYFLDILVFHYGNMLVKNSEGILSNFLNMICRLHNDNHGKQLMTIMNFKNTSINWRIQVLERVANMFNHVLNEQELDKTMNSSILREVKPHIRFLPVYTGDSAKACYIDFNEDADLMRAEQTLFTGQFVKYVNALMPVLFDVWIEACPDEELKNYTETTISNETSVLLKNVTKIIQSIIEYIETLDHDDHDYEHIKHSFINQYHKSYMRNFLSKFPYSTAPIQREFTNKSRKNQEDYSETKSNSESCLQQNLGLCRIHIWFTSLIDHNNGKFHKTTKNYCLSVIKYLNDSIEKWCINDRYALSQLTKLLRTLFLSASSAWYANGIDFSHTLQLIIKVSSHLSKNELQSNLSLIIGNIILECNLNELHREEAFKRYVASLPSLLLRPSIDEATIRMISQVALRFKQWIREELTTKHKAIIENAPKINIIGSHNDKQSRLMICNLFYFLNAEIYY